MAVTIKDVARQAGVSPITASRAFSGTHPVAEGTRQKVFKAAAELRYTPDLLARGLVRKQSPMIGVVVPALANPFFVTIVDAIQAAARERNHMVIINQSESSRDLEHVTLAQLRQLRVAGVLATPASPEMGHLERLREDGTAVVVVARRWEHGDYVTVDNFLGGQLVGEHLVRLGHRRVGWVSTDETRNTAVNEREQGFLSALIERGATSAVEWRLRAETLGTDEGAAAADRFCALRDRPTAMFVTADHLAIGFVHRLLQRGIRIPADVAVVGYDDIVYSEFLEVPLTTVVLPKYEMGRLAVQALFERLEGPDGQSPWRQVRLAPTLIVRASCGARG